MTYEQSRRRLVTSLQVLEIPLSSFCAAARPCVREVATITTSLRKLMFAPEYLRDEDIQLLANLRNLKQLDLVQCHITCEDWDIILAKRLPNLVALTLDTCEAYYELVRFHWLCPQLQRIKLSNTSDDTS